VPFNFLHAHRLEPEQPSSPAQAIEVTDSNC
jgi:hypothetical protein